MAGKGSPGLVFAILAVGVFLASLDLFIVNIAGFGFGALLVGGVSDAFQHHLGLSPADGLRWALLCSSVGGGLAALLFWRARRYIRAEVIT